MKVCNQVWVTAVTEDASCLDALLLLESLRRCMTNRKVFVILGNNVSKSVEERLRSHFDGVIGLQKDSKLTAKLFTWGSESRYEKCVFIHPQLFLLKNCDELFQHGKGFSLCNKEVNILVLEVNGVMDEEAIDLVKLGYKQLGNEYSYVIGKDCDESNLEVLEPKIVTFLKDLSPDDVKGERSVFHREVTNYRDKLKEIVELGHGLGKNEKEPIAVVGISCRFPGANDLEEYWNVLIQAEDQLRPAPDTRWKTEDGVHPTAFDRSIPVGFLKCAVDEFDSKFFGMSPAELDYLDPQQRLSLEVAWEALEDAGINAEELKGTDAGIFTGTWKTDYYDILNSTGFRKSEFYRSYMGNSFGSTAGRLSFMLGVMGPNIATESGCSSSAVALGLACDSLRDQKTNISLVCGTNLILDPFPFEMWKSVLSKDGKCKAFDAEANGFARAEGVAVLVLKRLSDAVRDEDKMYGLVRGYGQTQEGMSKSMGTPTAACEALAMEIALSEAGVKPHEVSYVEAHGTGTSVGDPVEMEAITQVYSRGRNRNDPLVVGSVKTIVGHTESCSGLAGLIKTFLAFKHDTIPPHIHLNNLNPLIDLDKLPAIIPLQAMPWKRNLYKPRIAGLSCYGITGTDSHIIVQEPPKDYLKPPKFSKTFIKPKDVFTLSAKSREALDDLIEKYVAFLEENVSTLELADVCFTANTGRAHFPYRIAVVCSSVEDLLKKLQKRSFTLGHVIDSDPEPKICFLFPGQGSQYHSMGLLLYDTNPVFRKSFDECAKIFRNSYNQDISQHMWAPEATPTLHISLNSQCAIFGIEYALLKVWESWGLKMSAVMGHSFGEVCASYAAGALSLPHAVMNVVARGLLMEKVPKGKMMAVKGSEIEVLEMIEKMPSKQSSFWIDVATLNTPEQTVVSGREESILSLSLFCQEQGIKTHVLDSVQAFHSRDMLGIMPPLKEALITGGFSPRTDLKCEYISALYGRKMEPGETVTVDYWLKHCSDPVRFLEASKTVYELGYRHFLEIGSQPVLSALVTRNTDGLDALTCLPSMRRKEDEWTTILNSVAKLFTLGVSINWKEFHRYYPGKKIRLPYYAFQRKRYWFTPPRQGHLLGGANQLHPLIGSFLPNATGHKIYTSYIDLNNSSYISGHLIGKYTILPGAGFMEMCLAAGHAATLASFEEFYPPLAPILVENLVIQAPMRISSDEGCQAQTIVSYSEPSEDSKVGGGTTIKIFSEQGHPSGGKKWVCHASAKFSPVISSLDALPNSDLSSIKSRLPSDPILTTDFYTGLAEMGLNFAGSFKSLKQFWTNKNKELLAEVIVPEEDTGFLLHPIVLDAMVQSYLIEREDYVKLQVPIVIGKFIWLGRSTTKVNYVHLAHHSQGRMATLFDENGKKLGFMDSVQFIHTDLDSVTKSLEKQKLNLPMLLEENWRPTPNTLEPTPEDLKINKEVSPTWILFSNKEDQVEQEITKKLKSSGRKVVKIRGDPKNKEQMTKVLTPYMNSSTEAIIYLLGLPRDAKQEEFTHGYLNLEQIILKLFKTSPKIFTITKGAIYVGDQSPSYPPHPATLWGMSKTFRSENAHIFCKCIDLDPDSAFDVEEIFKEFWIKDKDYQVAYRQGVRHVGRISMISVGLNPLALPNSERFALVLPSTKTISDLKFGPMPKQALGGDMIEVEVKAAGLNFRDILSVMKPSLEFDDSNTVAADYSGIIVRVGADVQKFKVGDSVLGCNWGGAALPSHICTSEKTVATLPPHYSYAEGATISTAFCTAYHCLVSVAGLKKGETVLIHTASGAVGILAIQIAQYLGACVIATAGSRRKRAFLYNLGVKNVFSSRTLSFGEEVKNATGGKGVHLVLNSLTSPGFIETSLSCCAKNSARFVEMSKLNILSAEQVSKIRGDVTYTIVDLNTSSHSTWKTLYHNMNAFLISGQIKATPYTRFDALNIKDALGYLQKAKHIGKVVVIMPETMLKDGELESRTDLFNDRSTYLITGGLGGIGLEVMKWMSELGAKYIILCGRTEPNTKTGEVINKMVKGGTQVCFLQADVGNLEECKGLLKTIKELPGYPPLKGVMHAAGCLSDGLILDQNWDKFQYTFNGKVTGGWNLHNLTLDYNLEHFVVYSSIAAVLGAMGQSNHASGNTFLDTLAHHRHALGLPSTSIQWGQWGHVGVAAELEIPGMTPFTPSQALNALEIVMKAQKLQISVVDGEIAVWKLLFAWASTYMEELKVKSRSPSGGAISSSGNFQVNSEQFWREIDEAKDKDVVVQKYVRSVLSFILKLDEAEPLDEDQNFQDLGLDSLMMVEFKNILQTLLGTKVSFSMAAIADCNTVKLLTKKLIELIEEGQGAKD